jgi:excisionase family DNA binding protein
MNPPNVSRLLTVEEVALMLNTHPQTVYRLVYRKMIPFIRKKGIGIRFRKEDIERWLTEDISVPAKTA